MPTALAAEAARYTWASLELWRRSGVRIDWCAEAGAPEASQAVVLQPGFSALNEALAHLQVDGQADVAWLRLGHGVTDAGWQALQSGLDDAFGSVGALCPLSVDEAWMSPTPPSLAVQAGGGSALARAEPALAEWLWTHAPQRPLELGRSLDAAGVLDKRMAWALAQSDGGFDLDSVLASQGWVVAVQRQVLLRCMPELRRHLQRAEPTAAAQVDAEVGAGLRAQRQLWAAAHPLTGLRAAVGELWPQWVGDDEGVKWGADQGADDGVDESKSAAPSGLALPRAAVRRLHISHSWGGGLSKWIREFVTADQRAGSGEGWVLRSIGVHGAFGQRLALYAGTEEVAPLRFWELGVPIHATVTAHLQVQQILQEIVTEFGVQQVVVSSLIGHSLDVLRTGLPTLMVAHDHYPFCVALYAHFGGECRSCDATRLQRCLTENPDHRFFPQMQASEWMALREAFVATVSRAGLPIVAPVPSVAQRWQSMMPGLRPAHFRVIGHGLDMQALPAPPPPDGGRLRVLVLGRLTAEKGAGLLATMRDELLGFAELLLLGCGEDAAAQWAAPGVRCVANFQATELPRLLGESGAHVGLLMSTVPETFSYALSELWQAGIPVVATDTGALADRVQHGVDGWLVPADADALLQQLRSLHEERHRLAPVRTALGLRSHASVRDMVAAYDRLLQRPLVASADGTGHEALPTPQRGASDTGSHRLELQARPGYAEVLQVNPQVTWKAACRAFWQYTCHKASRSPRLPAGLQRWFAQRGG